jgi:glycosyltransferase involved in cell wall biosynthesis
LLVQSIQRAHWITTPSRAVLRQLHERFPETRGRSQSVAWGPTIPDEWLHRDPHERGASVGLGASAHPELQGLTTRPYFLTVANIENRKNLLLLPQALEGLSGFDWVFAGRAGYGSSEIMRQLQEFASRSKLRFHFLQELRTEALMQLYQGCVGVVLPSFDEGFGLPALEGASLGRPLILSNIEPFREIALDAALYFDPLHGAEALRAHVLQLLEDSALQRRLAAQAALRSQYFSWERTAKAFLEIYDKMERA